MTTRSAHGWLAGWLVLLAIGGCTTAPSNEPGGGALPGPGGSGATPPAGVPIAGSTPTATAGTTASGGAGGALATAGTGGAGGTGGAAGAGSGGAGGAAGVGGAAGAAGAAGAGGAGAMHTLPDADVDADGPFQVTVDEMGGGNTWVFHPTELGKDGLEHPIFVWGTGATSVPSQYMDHFTRMASHGFVIISPNTGSVNAMLLGQALDWILAENDRMGSTYYQKLDPTNVAMGGHSLGSVSTFDREAMETRLKTTIHIAGGSFDGAGSSKVKTPTAYICGETDFARTNCETDFAMVGTQRTFFSILTGIDHVGAARAALPGMIAWLRWHLAGEVEREQDFTCPGGSFCQDIWVSENKNW